MDTNKIEEFIFTNNVNDFKLKIKAPNSDIAYSIFDEIFKDSKQSKKIIWNLEIQVK